jgi:ABC-type branched-subunit amino acid transport system substrate-binding protein
MGRKFMTFAAAVCIAFFFAGASRAGTIKIGAVQPLSGNLAVYGQGFKMAIDLATAEINSKGGISGKKLEIVYEDGKGTAKDSVAAVQKLIDINKVPLILGPAASTNFLAVAPICERAHVVLIGAESASPAITRAGAYIFRVFPSDKLQGKGVAELVEKLGYKEVPVLFINNDWGKGLKDVFVADFTKKGGKVLAEIPYDQGKTDYRAQLLQIKRFKPKAAVALVYVKDGAVIFKQAYELGIKTQWIAGSAAKSGKLVKLAGKAVEGLTGTYPAFSNTSPAYKAFAAAWKKKYGDKKIGIFAEYNYDMVHLVAKALAKGGSTADGIRKALYEVSKGYVGVTGDKTFDSNGDVGSAYGVWSVKGGKIISKR